MEDPCIKCKVIKLLPKDKVEEGILHISYRKKGRNAIDKRNCPLRKSNECKLNKAGD
jgi:hypothetical protein